MAIGPGKVVFQDGRVVFVRHGGIFVRVSPNRLIKAGDEFQAQHEAREQNTSEDLQREMPKLSEDPQPGISKLPVEIISEHIQNDQILDNYMVNSQDTMRIKSSDRIKLRINPDDDWVTATITSRAGKATGQYKNWFNVHVEESNIDQSVDLGTIEWCKVDQNDTHSYEVNIVLIPRSKHGDKACIEAKEVELKKLQQFDTYEEVDDTGQFRKSTTWILWNKGEDVRARLVARGFEEDSDIPTDSPTVSKCVLRIMLSIAAAFGWIIKTTDIKSAFLQGRKLERQVFLTPPKEVKVPEGTIWKLNRCLYGLYDAARQFYHSVIEELSRVGCTRSTLDPALFYYKQKGKHAGILVSHIDDFLHAGNPAFEL